MIRAVFYVLIIFALAAGFVWLADNPGALTLSFHDYTIETTVMAGAIILIAIFVVARLLWLLLRGIIRAPRRLGRQVAERRRELGHKALTEGFIAVGSGDASLASYYTAESRYYAQHESLTLLLAAQTAQLTGDDMGARSAYEAMLADPKMRILGLRGLFLEARRRGDTDAARSFAAAADHEKPGLSWAGNALLEYQAADGEWTEALSTLANLTSAGTLDAERTKRLQAVLRVARAMELEDSEPQTARDLAFEAHRLVPELVPAAVLAARLATRIGDPRRAAKAIETTWKIEPHPDLAAAYMDVRPGESGRDRLKRIGHLAKIRANHIEGRLAMARVAIDAQDWPAAREELRGILATEPTERAYLLMAEIEEGEHGDIGRARDWLGRAVRAPRDPAWVADGYVFDHWEPVSPVSGRLDAFEWKVPAGRMPNVAEPPHAAAIIHEPEPMAEPAPVNEPVISPPAVIPPAVEAEPVKKSDEAPADKAEPAPSGEGSGAMIVVPTHQPDDPGPEPEPEPEPKPLPRAEEEAPPAKGKRFKLFPS